MRGTAYDRVLFLFPPTGAWCREDRCQSYFKFELVPSMRPPMEECESAAAVRAAGAQPFVIDAPAEGLSPDDVLARAAEIRPDLIAITVTFGTLDDDLSFAARLRERLPGTAVCVRGAPCFTQAERILEQEPAVDFCVRGEYELIFSEVVSAGFENAGGVVHRRDGRIVNARPSELAADLDSLPRPDRSVIDESLYRVRGSKQPQATVRVQRGCPYPCSYCLVWSVSGSNARHRSPEGVAEELAELRERGISFAYLRADTFSLDREWAQQTSDAIRRRAPGVHWVTTTRVDCVDRDTLASMAAAGCYGVSFGIDTGSAKIGEKIRKPPRLDKATQAMRLCDELGILSLGYFMVGFLWDTPETLAETGAFIRAARPDLLTLHFAHPYPGTRYHDDVSAAGAAIVDRRAQAEPALAVLEIDALHDWARKTRRSHYARPRVAFSLARKLAALAPHLLRRGAPRDVAPPPPEPRREWRDGVPAEQSPEL